MTEVTDRYGQPVSTASADAVVQYVEGLDRHLALSAGADACFEAALAADSNFALARAGLAVVQFYAQRQDAARLNAAWAAAQADWLTRRERGHVEAVAAFVCGTPSRANTLVREQLAEQPGDALILQLALVLNSASGSLARREAAVTLLEQVAPAYGDDWWFLSAYAYALNELGPSAQAQDIAERALALQPRAASAVHSLTHIWYDAGEHDSGTTLLNSWLPAYGQAEPYFCHLSWHLALFELAAGREWRALEIYEQAISPAVAQVRTTLVDASSTLWRLELLGDGAPSLPWSEVCCYAASVRPPAGRAFLDAHAILAFAGAGDEVALETLIAELARLAETGHELATELTLPLARGIAAFKRGAYGEAADRLAPLDGRLNQLGGSEAQLEVFEDTLLQALLRDARHEPARRLLDRRLARRPSRRDRAWLKQTSAPDQPTPSKST